MLFKLTPTFLLLLAAGPAAGTLDITLVDDAAALVEFIVQNENIVISNAMASGHACKAIYTGGEGVTDSFPPAGVLLSTGNPFHAAGPDDSEYTTTSFGAPGDADLTALAGSSTNDACVLQFDFECPDEDGCDVYFNYVFGSEEYLEYVDSSFNDVFGFFLDGSNIALIPGTTIPVSINTVNSEDASMYFIENEDFSPYDIEADGFTTTLTAFGSVDFGTHSIKMAVADAGDFSYDAWVFLQAGTFGFVDPGTVSSGGDPHFMRFGHHKRSTFHGECDLVFLDSRESDLAIHLRTTIEDFYSYIEQVAMKVGDITLEFHGGKAYVDGSEQDDAAFPLDLGHIKILKDPNGTGKHKEGFQVDLQDGLSVEIKATKAFMAVTLKGNRSGLVDAVGMLGQYATGDLYGRDGSPIADFEEHAFEWQVHPDEDGSLFMKERSPQFPYERCRMPIARTSRRALRSGADRKLLEQAEAECSAAHPEDIELCIDDVMMTGDLDILGAW